MMMTMMMMEGGGPYSHTCFHKGEPVTALEGHSTEKGRDPLICPRNDPLLEKPKSLRWKQFLKQGSGANYLEK